MDQPVTTIRETNNPAAQRKAAAVPENMPVVVFYNFSDLIERPVRYEDETRPLGHLQDIGGSTTTSYPLSVSIEVSLRGRKGHQFFPWSSVISISPKETILRRDETPAPTADFWARRDVLDDKVVDVSGAKVLRVNDVHLIYSDNNLIFGHVEVGLRGILRRLRFERPVAFLAQWLFDYTIKESFVTWRHIEVMSPGGIPGGVRVSKLSDRLADIQPAELADIMEQLGVKDRQALFNSLSVETAADALEEVTPEFQRTLVSHGEPNRVADILEEMPPDEAADVLRDLGPDAANIINRMEHEAAAEMHTLLSHKEESAGGVMDSDCIEATPDSTSAATLDRIRQAAGDIKVYSLVYVIDESRVLKGVASLRELFKAAPDTTLDNIMNRELVTVTPDTRLRDVAREFAKYGFQAIPVVDVNGVFQGVVRYDSVLSQLADFIKD